MPTSAPPIQVKKEGGVEAAIATYVADNEARVPQASETGQKTAEKNKVCRNLELVAVIHMIIERSRGQRDRTEGSERQEDRSQGAWEEICIQES